MCLAARPWVQSGCTAESRCENYIRLSLGHGRSQFCLRYILLSAHGPTSLVSSSRFPAGKMQSRLGSIAIIWLAASLSTVSGQTFRRLGTCPSLGCVLPPDQQDFLPGQQFDIRFEIHAPKNGSEAFNNGVPDEKFTATIAKDGQKPKSIIDFFKVPKEPALEKWTFSWYEDLFAQDAKTPSVVNVASKIYRRVALYEPGTYTVTLSYYSGKTTTATWFVRPLATKKKAKNVIFFIGMVPHWPHGSSSLTVFRGRHDNEYDHCCAPPCAQNNQWKISEPAPAGQVPGYRAPDGMSNRVSSLQPYSQDQQSHSIDSFITDSANSASALYSGHKSTVNAMGYDCNLKYWKGLMLTLWPAFMPTRHQMLSMTPRLRLSSSSWCASG